MTTTRGAVKRGTEISVVLADDHKIVRQGFRALLEREPDIRVVGEAGDGLSALELVARLRPDVLVLDLMMPGLGGLEVLRQAAERSQQARVVVLTMHADEAYVVQALDYGALGFVLKCGDRLDLLRAIRKAMDGRRYLGPPLTEQMIAAYRHRAREGQADPYERLTNRERQVLQLVVEGYSSAEIAVRLGASVRTIETHRGNMRSKLNVRTPLQMVQFAMRRGLIAVRA